jgi:uncharacterized protein YyaL (SSP411 family)
MITNWSLLKIISSAYAPLPINLDGFIMTNRLAQEKSPYLLQHAQNPVDWYPWADEAFIKAANEDKPIFLSVGYSTCHWCHVMERESFEDEEVAKLLNDTFVCIKVDREERPDIDNIYMTVCSMMTGSGGWPLTIIMTPDKKPFFAGTYFAKHTQNGRIGMLDLIPRLHDIWQSRRDEVLHSTEKIFEVLQQQNKFTPGRELDQEILHHAFNELSGRYDSDHPGFSKAPKFPTPHIITFLLRYWKMTGNEHALSMVEQTLTAMRLGGIFDQVGFGFHRYSTDEKWLLPHFEKMLYDQALLAIAYLEAFQVTGNPLFKQTADEIFTYVSRDMTAPEGGFYSAEDADSEGVEGKFYVWSLNELQKALSPEEAEFIQNLYNIKSGGNFHDEATGGLTGANIFHLVAPASALLTGSTQKSGDIATTHENIRNSLFNLREKRIHPHKDDKILTDWNGLMIGALAQGARILDNDIYLEAAVRGTHFVLSGLRKNDKLMHRYRDGESAVDGMLCDYAYTVWGLLELYAANFETEILGEAILLNERMLHLFWDDKDGGLFLTPKDGESLLVRPKEIYDGALPSGNSIALNNLLRLEHLTANSDFGAKAKLLVRAFSDNLLEVPSGYTQFLSSLSFALSPTTEVVIVGSPKAPDTLKMLSVMKKCFSPQIVTLLKDPNSDSKRLAALAPFTAIHTAIDGKATAYVCRNYSCKSPTTDPLQLKNLLWKE